jgi:2-polyprenyl-3-methyl-5-hydroxy-6-metoxy-1,4-benzoquinol methylase
VYLAEQGWTVTAVDGVAQALSKARARAQSRGVEVNWVEGDVCRLEHLGIGDAFDLMLDRGCFHDFTDDQRDQYARTVSAVARPGAVLLMFAFQPRKRGLGPRGITAEELTRQLGKDWELLSSTQDTEVRLPRWLGNVQPTWHRLRRRPD